MNKEKVIVRWSPHTADYFVVANEDLRLFQNVCTVTGSSYQHTTDGSLDNESPTISTKRKRSFRLLDVQSDVPQLKCLDWYPESAQPNMLAVGLGSGKLVIMSFLDKHGGNTGGIHHEFMSKYSRPCNAVAWNPQNPSQIATGLEKVRSDFCTLVWDLNQSTSPPLNTHRGHRTPKSSDVAPSKPLHELANSEATVALSWVPSQPSCLVTGTGFKWLRMYDLRGSSNAPLSVIAHTKAVYGVQFSSYNTNLLATYSEGLNEAIKIWDIRKLDNPSGPVVTIHTSTKTLSDISWSPTKNGILATTSLEERWISLWDINKSQVEYISEIKIPCKRRYTTEPIISFSWHKDDSNLIKPIHNKDSSSTSGVETAFSNRLLIAGSSGEVGDISLYDSMPLCMSSNGTLVFACGKLLFGGDSFDANDFDISKEMMYLAQNNYSISSTTNLGLFDSSISTSSNSSFSSTASMYRKNMLYDLWNWIVRIESFRSQRLLIENKEKLEDYPLMGYVEDYILPWPSDENFFLSIGINSLLSLYPDQDNDNRYTFSDVSFDSILGCNVYHGKGRHLALIACGWDPTIGSIPSTKSTPSLSKLFTETFAEENNNNNNTIKKQDLILIISQCKKKQQYERGAMLALFHGDFRTSINTLQEGANEWEKQMERPEQINHLQIQGIYGKYIECMRLVGMCIAGFSAFDLQDDLSSNGNIKLWLEMCHNLAKHPTLMKSNRPHYLQAICYFFIGILASRTNNNNNNNNNNTQTSSSNSNPRNNKNNSNKWSNNSNNNNNEDRYDLIKGFHMILMDNTLPLQDRIGFGCRFLSGSGIQKYLNEKIIQGEKKGLLETFFLCGFNTQGFRILQTYLDNTGDIQTIALLIGRLPRIISNRNETCNKWMECYRQLLNDWKFWYARSELDVGYRQLQQEYLKQYHHVVNREQEESLNNNNYGLKKNPSLTQLKKDLNMKTSSSISSQLHQSNDFKSELNADTISPQLYVRCNFCSTSLSLSQMLRQGTCHNSWLTRSKPKLTCCPSCGKPLPQCAICLLPFGSLNPYYELATRRAKQVDDNYPHEENILSELSNIPFVEWFTWCQTCRHGGHAHHMHEWFEKHDECPVTDCNCRCNQLDRFIKK